MPVYPTSIVFEMLIYVRLTDEAGDYLVDEDGNYLSGLGWQDVSADVIAGSCAWKRGNSGRTIFDRVADIGTLSLVLNNSEFNSHALAGAYSPDNDNVVDGFGLDTVVRLTITENGTTHEEWQGKISSITPAFGNYGKQTTQIVCEDWMANAYRDRIRGITVQTNKRDDELLDILLALASSTPTSTDFSTGDDAYTYALHDENSLTSTLARVFQKIAMSGLGMIFLTGYDTLVYRSRSELLLTGVPEATFSDDMLNMKVTRKKNQRVKDVFVTTYPVEVDASAVVLWAARKEVSLTAGESKTFDVSFRDPSGRNVRVSSTELTAPVANTDYKFSSTSGSGTDLNASLGITVALKSDIATITLTNNAGVTGYLWFHQQRGKGVYLYEPVTAYGETGQSDGETINVDMVYQDDQNVGMDIKDLITYWYLFDQSDVADITFIANYSQDFMDAAFLPCGSLVSIQESQTGINGNYIVNGVQKKLTSKYILQVTWNLIPANQITGIWRLDVVGFSELDSTTKLGA